MHFKVKCTWGNPITTPMALFNVHRHHRISVLFSHVSYYLEPRATATLINSPYLWLQGMSATHHSATWYTALKRHNDCSGSLSVCKWNFRHCKSVNKTSGHHVGGCKRSFFVAHFCLYDKASEWEVPPTISRLPFRDSVSGSELLAAVLKVKT